MNSPTLKLGFLASRNGSSMRALIEAIEAGELAAEALLVVSNNKTAGALEFAAAHGVPTLVIPTQANPEAADARLCAAMEAAGAELIVASGYLRRLGPKTLARYRNRVINIHPGALPAFGGEGMYGRRVHEAVIAAGARTVNIPDTVGYNVPEQFGRLIQRLIEQVPNSDQAIFSIHCHNDLGLAVANSLAAVTHGARQVECTINGLGERAGNAALEEIVMAIRTRRDFYGLELGIDTTQIMPCSRLVSTITGFPVQPNKAIVGANAFAHESGIHQDGVLKSRETYEIMRAQDVGWDTNRLVLGKHSGRNAFRTRLADLGVVLDSEAEVNEAFQRFKILADKKHEIFDDDLLALVTDVEWSSANEHLQLVSLKVCSETGEVPRAEMTLRIDGQERQVAASGAGPVDAVFKAIRNGCGTDAELLLYSVNAITSGTDAQGDVTVRLSDGARVVADLAQHATRGGDGEPHRALPSPAPRSPTPSSSGQRAGSRSISASIAGIACVSLARY